MRLEHMLFRRCPIFPQLPTSIQEIDFAFKDLGDILEV